MMNCKQEYILYSHINTKMIKVDTRHNCEDIIEIEAKIQILHGYILVNIYTSFKP